MFKLFLYSLPFYFLLNAQSNIPLSRMADPTEGFVYPSQGVNHKLSGPVGTWENQRAKIAQELASRLEMRAKEYDNTLNTRNDLMNQLRSRANELHKLEKNYIPYEKGNNIFRIAELRTQIGESIKGIKAMDTALEGYERSLQRAAKKLERFGQQSLIAPNTTAQMELVKNPTAKNMLVYVNNPQIENIKETIQGLKIGTSTNKLPKDLIENGSLKTTSEKTVPYKAGDKVMVRAADGGLVRGTLMGATAAGELVIKEVLAPGMQQLKSGEYRTVKLSEISSVSMLNPSHHVADAWKNVEKLRAVGGKHYELKINDVSALQQINSRYTNTPAANSTGSRTLPNQGPLNPAQPLGIR